MNMQTVSWSSLTGPNPYTAIVRLGKGKTVRVTVGVYLPGRTKVRPIANLGDPQGVRLIPDAVLVSLAQLALSHGWKTVFVVPVAAAWTPTPTGLQLWWLNSFVTNTDGYFRNYTTSFQRRRGKVVPFVVQVAP